MSNTQQRTTILVYARRSKVVSESDRFNVDGQLAALRAECTKRGFDQPPFTIEEYIDAKGHRSGRHEYTRPEWLKLRARLTAPDVLAVMFYTIDRASRSVRDFADLIESCKALNVGIIALIDGVDTLAGVGRRHLDLHMRAMIAQDESDLASERMTRRIALKREKGIPHEQRRRAIYHLIERVDINQSGEITRVLFREWAHAAFTQVLSVARAQWLNVALDRCQDATLAVALDWFAERAA